MATRDEIGRELLERIQQDHPELYETLLGVVPRGELPAEKTPAEDPGRTEWEAEQRRLQTELENRLKNLALTNLKGQAYLTQKYKIHDELRGKGLGRDYHPQQQAKTPEELRQAYQQEMQGVRGGTEQALIIRQKYRKLGLDL